MSAPLPGRRGPARVLRAVMAAVLSVVLAITLLGGSPVAAGDADSAERPPPPPVGPTYESREDLSDVDAPRLPPGCFGPAVVGIDPFPCPLNGYRRRLPTIIIWGDSHAYEWIPALREAVRRQKVNLISFVAGSCPPVLITNNNGPGACRRSNYVALRTVIALKRQDARFKVIIGSNWSGFRRAYRRLFLEQATGQPSGYNDFTKDVIRLAHVRTPALFERFGRMGIDVDLIAQSATVPERRAACTDGDEPYNCDLPRYRAIPEERKTAGYVRHLQDKITGRSRLIDATTGYCSETVCAGKIGEIETYFDDLHLSATRTRNLARFFRPAVRDMLR